MTFALLAALALTAWGVGGPDGVKAAGLALSAAFATTLVGPLVGRAAGPIGAYALEVGLRGMVTFGGAAILVAARGVDDAKRFWAWLLAAYLVALVSETVRLARPRGEKG